MKQYLIPEGTTLDSINKRLIIRKYSRHELIESIKSWKKIALNNGYEKIWLWSFPEDLDIYLANGFVLEGLMEKGPTNKPAASLAYYLNPSRQLSPYSNEEDELLKSIISFPPKPLVRLSKDFTLSLLNHNHCQQISAILGEVFVSYPTPVHKPDYINKLLQSGCLFGGIFHRKRLISIASAYPEKDLGRCELTDCATLPDYRGLSLTERVLMLLEKEILKNQSALTLYSLARARSYGVNRVFHKLNYEYQGRLINNCYISGGLEDMNLWVKV